jgi:hypothetical protein
MVIYDPKVLLFFGWRIWKCFFTLKFNSFYRLYYGYIYAQFIKMSLWHFNLSLIVNKIMNSVCINNHDNKPVDAIYVLDLAYDVNDYTSSNFEFPYGIWWTSVLFHEDDLPFLSITIH